MMNDSNPSFLALQTVLLFGVFRQLGKHFSVFKFEFQRNSLKILNSHINK